MLSKIFGTFSWSAPAWMASMMSAFKAHPRWLTLIGFLILASTAALVYVKTLPKPSYIPVVISDIKVQPERPNLTPQPLEVRFGRAPVSTELRTHGREIGIPPMPRQENGEGVAHLALLGKKLDANLVALTPKKEGMWRWDNDQTLVFLPKTPWPPGQDYTLKFAAELFESPEKIELTGHTFATPDFRATLVDTAFYQDPQNTSIRRVVATVKFTHPVDKKSFEEFVSLQFIAGQNGIGAKRNYKHRVTFSESLREAFIASTPIELPKNAATIEILVEKGARARDSDARLNTELRSKVLIPDIYSFLKVSESSVNIVRDESGEPQQILHLAFTDEIAAPELLSKLSIHLLPQKKSGQRTYSIANVPESLLTKSRELRLKMVDNPRGDSKSYNFVLDVPANRKIYVGLSKGLNSVNGFIKTDDFRTVLNAPAYPQEVKIMGEGAVLTNTGNQQLSVSSRGLNGIKYRISQLNENQIYHLVSQTSGDISNPGFKNWSFNFNNLSTVDEKTVSLNKRHPAKANFSSLDLSNYIKGDKKFGIFHVEAKGWNVKRRREIYQAKDERLVIVTDLGVIVKNNADNSRHIFVQSISSGQPVSGAQVELLAINGKVLFTANTNKDGLARLPTTQGLNRQNQPTVYVVKKDNDLSFLPFTRYSRQINVSKFDIGGASMPRNNRSQLSAFVFTDRGIYRPGETVKLGVITKNINFTDLKKEPLEVVISGPRGERFYSQKYSLDDIGFNEISLPVKKAANTGNYNVAVYLLNKKNNYRNNIGSGYFSVEEFQPDTLKIESTLVGAPKKGWVTQSELVADVMLKNLFGSPAQNRKVTASLTVVPSPFVLPGYKEYRFDAGVKDGQNIESIRETLAPIQTDDDGKAKFTLDLSSLVYTSYLLRLNVNGFDEGGGRSVSVANSVYVSPLKYRVGYKSDGDLKFIRKGHKRTIDLVALNNEVELTDLEGLSASLFKKQKISTLVKQNNGTYQYQTIEKRELVNEKTFAINKRVEKTPLDTSATGDYIWTLRDENGRLLVEIPYAVVGLEDLTGQIDKNAELSVKLNKGDYKAGELIELAIKAPYAGSGLITIESNTVHAYQWFSTKSHSSIAQIKIPESLEGSAYVNVVFVRDTSSKDIFTSPLSYAVVPFSLDKSQRQLDITLDAPKLARPGKAMNITYSASKPSKVVVFAVNEGILQVANYRLPKPLEHFVRKRALSVTTMQMLDLILPDFSILKALSAAGGGILEEVVVTGVKSLMARQQSINAFSRKLDQPAVFWSGIVDADTTTRSVSFNVPNTFAGQLRVMAVAVSESALGSAQTATLVRGPFVISPAVVKHAAPGDVFEMSVGVANLIESLDATTQVSFKATASPHLEIIDGASQTLTIAQGDEGVFKLKAKVLDNLGAANVKFDVSSGEESASRVTTLSVRPATHYTTSLNVGHAKSGVNKITLERKLWKDYAYRKLESSHSPLVLTGGLNQYLKYYPHGCTEQLVSRIFPQVVFASHPTYKGLLDSSGLELPGAGFSNGDPTPLEAARTTQTHELQNAFNNIVATLVSRQTNDGGFAFWSWAESSQVFPTLYSIHFLIESQENGYQLPPRLLSNSRGYLKRFVQDGRGNFLRQRHRAMAIYLLTRLGDVTTNYLVDLEDTLTKNFKGQYEKDILVSYIGASYKLLKKDDVAVKLMKQFKLNSIDAKKLSDFDSVLAHDAQHIYLLGEHFPQLIKSISTSNIIDLSRRISKGEFNTLSSSYTLLALASLGEAALGVQADTDFDFYTKLLGQDYIKANAKSSPFPHIRYDVNTTALKIQAQASYYYVNTQAGYTVELPSKKVANGLEVYRTFIDDDGNELSQITLGEEITAVVRVRSTKRENLTNIAVIDLLPAGFEVIRSSLPRSEMPRSSTYIDVREDRLVYYGDFTQRMTEIKYKVKATSVGDFTVPALYGESMYDLSIQAWAPSGNIKVVAP